MRFPVLVLLTTTIVFVRDLEAANEWNDDDFLSLLMTDYNKMVRPTDTYSPTTNVNHSLALQRIVKFDSNELTMDTWMITMWRDTRLSKTVKRFRTDFDHISIPKSVLWIPDITLYQRPTTNMEFEPSVLLYDGGKMVYVPSTRIWTDDCTPVNDEMTECSFRFGPWTYNTDDLNLQSEGVTLYEYRQHPEYEIIDTTAERRDQKDPCCGGSWAYIRYTITIKRR